MTAFTIHVVDDDRAVCTSIVRLLRACGFEAAGYTSPHDFLAVAARESQGCVVLDYDMPQVSGAEVQKALAANGSNWQVVFLSGEVDVFASVEAMKSGAADVLTKPATRETRVAAGMAAQERMLAASRERAARDEALARVASLTPRQREVLGHVVCGRLNKQIADALGTSERTVKHHRGAMMRKLGVHSVADLVRLAEKAGIAPV